MILCIAEKPDAAKAIAQALSPKLEKKNGYLEGSNGIVYTWAVGHLLTQVEPHEIDERYKERRMEDLPILPKKIPLKVIPGKETQLNIIRSLIKRATLIYNCCDSAAEGQAIYMRIHHYLNVKVPVKRLWTSSLQPKAIQQAFKNAKDNQEYQLLTEAGILRSEADWLIGMNASRAASLVAHSNIRAGRVLLPVLSILYDRDYEIQNFKKTNYYVLESSFEQNGIIYKGERLYEDGYPVNLNEVEQAKALVSNNPSKITEIEKGSTRLSPPKLFDLTELSRVANSKFGYKATDTLSYLQELYLKKLVTYPRTNSQYVSESEIALMHESFDVLAVKYQALAKMANKQYVSIENKHICDASKIEDHHAVLPEPVAELPNDLTEHEQNIYQLVVERFFLQFYPEAVIEYLKVITSCADSVRFLTHFKSIVQMGWKVVYQDDEDNEGENEPVVLLQQLPTLQEGAVLYKDSSIHSKETSPPVAFTDGTLIQLMKNISRRVDDPKLKKTLTGKGLGTAATRGEIIKKLEVSQYTQYKGRKIEITKMGRSVIELFRKTKINTLTSPEFTALWEQSLNEIQKGNRPQDEFEQRMRTFCQVIVQELAALHVDVTAFEKEGIASCPKCKRPVYSSKTRYYCSDQKNNCDFFLWKTQYGKTLSDANIKQLFEKGQTNTLTFTNMKKVKYKARLVMPAQLEQGKLSIEYVN